MGRIGPGPDVTLESIEKAVELFDDAAKRFATLCVICTVRATPDGSVDDAIPADGGLVSSAIIFEADVAKETSGGPTASISERMRPFLLSVARSCVMLLEAADKRDGVKHG